MSLGKPRGGLRSINPYYNRDSKDSMTAQRVLVPDQMAGFGTSVPNGFKEKAKTTAPDKPGRMTIRRYKEHAKTWGQE